MTRNDADCASWVIFGGEYTGGLLWVEHPDGKFNPPREIWRTPSDASRLGYMYDTNQTWVKLPAGHLLHGVTKVTGARVSMSYYVPSFPVQEWVKRHPGSVYVPMDQDFVTAIQEFPKIEIQEARGVKDSSHKPWLFKSYRAYQDMWTSTFLSWQRKAVRGTVDKEREKWMVYVVKPAVKEDGS
eukprot:3514848-Amphidinium_carterae.1